MLPNIANRNSYTEVENFAPDPSLSKSLVEGLKALGHDKARLNDMNSGLHGIRIHAKQHNPSRPRYLVGAVDPRREGLAIGD